VIIDVHTHFWLPEHQGLPWSNDVGRVSRSLAADDMHSVDAESYLAGMSEVSRSVVFGLQAHAAGIHVPNDAVADFVRQLAGRAVGFMSVDPLSHDAIHEIDRCVGELDMRGIKLGPLYQGTSPLEPRVMRVFARAEQLGLPVMIHQGAVFSTAGRLQNASPLLLDDVALTYPNLKLIVAHMGHPWVNETAIVMRRHRNIFADTSAIASRPTIMANALIAAKEYGVLDRVLFGSDSPMVTAESTISRLRAIVRRTQEIAYTPITDEDLESLLHRPSFDLLEISS
jgi:Predicted metal-dependent hydrolase of the TIM-barrel fold